MVDRTCIEKLYMYTYLEKHKMTGRVIPIDSMVGGVI